MSEANGGEGGKRRDRSAAAAQRAREGEAAGKGAAAGKPLRVVTSSMIGMAMPQAARWSRSVVTVLGLNPGPFTGPGTNTFVIGCGRRRLLLDAGQGVDGYDDLLERALESECDGAELDRIVVTHAHPDHIGGVAQVCERFGDLTVEKMPLPARDLGSSVSELGDGDVVETQGATLEAIWTPGHAGDHLCFYLHEEKTLFSGDMVLGAGTTVIPPDGDLEDYLESLRRLLALGAERIFPAHGPVIEDPAAKISEYLAHRALRDEQILEGLREGLGDTADLVRRIYVDVPEFLHRAAAASVEAHLRRFLKQGRVLHEGEQWKLA